MNVKPKGTTYKDVEKKLRRNANILDHYSTPRKISKGKKVLQLIHTRLVNLFSAASMSMKKSR